MSVFRNIRADGPYNPAADGTQELKHWQALLKYVSSFKDTDTTPNMIKNIPAAYASPQRRIVKQ